MVLPLQFNSDFPAQILLPVFASTQLDSDAFRIIQSAPPEEDLKAIVCAEEEDLKRWSTTRSLPFAGPVYKRNREHPGQNPRMPTA